MNKTDAEIEKALECCSNWQSDKSCEECPENTYGFGCAQKMAKHALDYINRLKAKEKEQQEEIEKYEHIKATINDFWDILLKLSIAKRKEKPTLEELADALVEIKAEAIKEFAERVKQKINFPLAVWKVFDNLVKEMTENEGKE